MPPEGSRAERSAAKIHDAALAILRSAGPSAVTVEAVAAASGVAKTTIYRRYRDRAEMLEAALASVVSAGPIPADADGEQRLRWIIDRSLTAVAESLGVGGFAGLLTDADPQFTDIMRNLLVEHRSYLVDALTEGEQLGLFRSGLDAETVVDLIVGASVAERARTGAVADDWAGRIFATAWPAVAP